MKKTEKIAKLKEAKELGILTAKEYLKKVKALTKPEPSNEVFSWKKVAKGMFSLFDPVEWSQTFREMGITDVRKWIIAGLILLAIYGWGYFKGIKNKSVHFDLRGKEATIALNEHYLHILRDGTAQVENNEGKVLKKIAVSDIPELKRHLKPIGIDVRPFFTTGYGASSTKKSGVEAGAGVSLFKFYKTHLDTWLTNHGVYLGADYQITDNSGAILGAGKGFQGDNRVYFGWKFNF